MKKLAFFHFPKTGGSFFGYYVREHLMAHVEGYGHHLCRNKIPETAGQYKITFLRNPLKWYVSRYFYYMRPDFKIEGGVSINCDSGISGKEFRDKFPDFETHLRWGFDNIENFSMAYRYKQMLCDEEGALQMDYVGKVETLQDDLSEIMDLVGIPPPEVSIDEYYQQKRNEDKVTNRSFHEPYQTYYTDELLKIIYDSDQFIFDEYGYE